MLLELMITLTSGLLLAVSALVAHKIIVNKLALARFRKLSRNLPISPGASLLFNHTSVVPFGSNPAETLRRLHAEMGKTIGGLLGDKFGVSTIDLDLIKRFMHDEPGVHMDRMRIGIPFKEFDDTIMTAPKDEWQQLRRAIAPAFA
jgi:hypothetical protein